MKLTEIQTLPRRTKRAIILMADWSIIISSFYLAASLRYGTAIPFEQLSSMLPLAICIMMGAPLLIIGMRLPWIKLTTLEITGVQRIAVAAIGLSAATVITAYVLQVPAPRSVPLIMGFVFFLGALFWRILAVKLLRWINGETSAGVPVAIYGAGAAGIQLALALRQSSEATPVVFLDDNPTLNGLMVAGLPVHEPKRLNQLIDKHDLKRVLVAIPSANQDRRDAILADLNNHDVEVRVLPSYIEMMTNEAIVRRIDPVSPDALLGRNKVDLEVPEIAKTFAGRTIMITGAGGSIGSELCRQLLNCRPAQLILFEQSEFALYSVDRELRALTQGKVDIIPRLGSVTDPARVSDVISTHNVEIILHAAAYKHVPLVEENELEGAKNNILGTQIVADAASNHEVERFILVSTDKAVRPTNIMGATKRLAECMVQDIQTRTTKTKFSMVRFGNVLGSSGSVLPLFEKQIAAGGPITVTHSDITRYFMTIPEAARLVLLAGAYAKTGDLFVLDMGEPQKIIDIAHQMIELSGRTVRDPTTGVGDIDVQITGLRPGEKLYEELLIDGDSLIATPHPKIMRAREQMRSQIEMAAIKRDLTNYIADRNSDALRSLIADKVEGYHTQDTAEAG